ncbi:MAG: NAAT family transporter [Leucobacter sp.]|nr:NAAT family transporter [Leucobacter sp.]
MDETALITAGVALFTICNPIGTIPVFLSVTADKSIAQQRRIALMTGVGVFSVLAVSLLLGSLILQFFGIGVAALKIAGFLFVATIAWAMMTKTGSILPTKNSGSPAIVPLAMPVVAGPGAIALVIAFAKENPALTDYLWGLVIVLASAVATAVIFFFAPYLAKALGPAGMEIFQKLFGLILLAICVDQILTSMPSIWPGLAGTS